MLKRLALGLVALFLPLAPALAAPNPVVSFDVGVCDPSFATRCIKPNADGTVPISGSISASFSGFTPVAGAVANLAVSTTSSDVTLPAGATVIVTNAGAADASFRIQVGAGTALTTDQVIKSGAAVGLAVGANTHLSAITTSGTTTLNLQGGSGAAAGYGGGGSGGGGGGAVTAASGSYASGALAADAIVDLGTGGSPAANTVNARLATINTTLGTPLQAGGNIGNISGTISLPTGASTSANQTTEIGSLATIATNSGTQATAANQTSIIGTKGAGTAATNSALIGGVFNTVAPTLTTGQQAAAQLDTSGNLKVNVVAGGAGGGAVTVASGADVVEGATGDTSATNTVFGNLQAIKANTSGPIPTQASTVSIGGVGLLAGTAVVGVVGNSQASTTSGQSGPLVQGAVTTAAPTYTTAQTNPLSLTTAGALRVDGSAVTQPSSMVDGGSVAFGSKADAATCATTNTFMSCARQLHTDLTGSIPAGAAIIGQVGIDQTTQGTTNKVVAVGAAAANATASGNPVQVGGVYNTAVTAATTGQAMPLGLDVYGQIAEAPYGPMMTALTGASGNVANANAVATLAAAVGKTTYITGFQCTAAGSTAALVVNLTVAGVITGTMTYTFVFPAGVTTLATPVNVTFSRPVPASTTNTAIVVTLPAGGAGNPNAACNAQGFRL